LEKLHWSLIRRTFSIYHAVHFIGVSFNSIFRRMLEFSILFDKNHSNRSVEVTTAEMVESVNRIVFNDHRINVHEIADIVGISYERIIKFYTTSYIRKSFLQDVCRIYLQWTTNTIR